MRRQLVWFLAGMITVVILFGGVSCSRRGGAIAGKGFADVLRQYVGQTDHDGVTLRHVGDDFMILSREAWGLADEDEIVVPFSSIWHVDIRQGRLWALYHF